MADERRMTFVVIPQGGRELDSRSFEISYRRLRVVGVAMLVAVVAWVAMAASWTYVAAQAARIPGLQREIARLETQEERVQRLALELQRLTSQYEQVRAMLGADRPPEEGSIWLPPASAGAAEEAPADSAQASIPSSWPLTERGFVTREHLGRIPGQHPGIDIAVGEGSYVRAAGAGVVAEAGEDPVYGRFVRILHGEGYESVYGHASELFVQPRDSVARHEVVALSGNTGTSTAPHLHFEIWKDGEPIDPRTLVDAPG